MIFYYLIFLLFCFFCVLSQNKKNEKLIYYAACFILFVIAAFRSENIDKDYSGYVEYYDDILTSGWSIVEPSFIFITKLVGRTFNDIKWLFFVYALLGVGIKSLAINQLTKFKLLALIIYFSTYFLLFEMTQIRAGVAAGLLLFCVRPIKERKLFLFLLFTSLAILFHYSAIVILPLYFLKDEKLNLRFYSLLLPIAYLLYFVHIDLFSVFNLLPISLIQAKLTSYGSYALEDNSINLFNVLQIFRCSLAFLFLWKSKLLAKHTPYGNIILKIYFFALFTFVAFASIPGISSRASELLLIVEIILIPNLVYLFKSKVLGYSLVIIIGICFLSFALYYTQLVKAYF